MACVCGRVGYFEQGFLVLLYINKRVVVDHVAMTQRHSVNQRDFGKVSAQRLTPIYRLPPCSPPPNPPLSLNATSTYSDYHKFPFACTAEDRRAIQTHIRSRHPERHQAQVLHDESRRVSWRARRYTGRGAGGRNTPSQSPCAGS
jgi:hypothetical protein